LLPAVVNKTIVEVTGATRTTTGAMIKKAESASSSVEKTKVNGEAEVVRSAEVSKTNVVERGRIVTLIVSCATIGSPRKVARRAMQVDISLFRQSGFGKGKTELRDGRILEEQTIITQTCRVIVYDQIINYWIAFSCSTASNNLRILGRFINGNEINGNEGLP
jgi:hypothetical protein